MNSIKRLNVLLAAVALSCASSFAHAQTTSHQHASHHHVVAQSASPASMDHEPTQEEAAKAIEMVYNDSVAALHYGHPNAELFNCNCTIYNQGQ